MTITIETEEAFDKLQPLAMPQWLIPAVAALRSLGRTGMSLRLAWAGLLSCRLVWIAQPRCNLKPHATFQQQLSTGTLKPGVMLEASDSSDLEVRQKDCKFKTSPGYIPNSKPA